MKEDLLHFVWRTRHFRIRDLRTTDNHQIEIVDFGQYNPDAGPDFKNARVRIDGTLWAGNVEMHLTATEWDRHGHTDDPAYHNVILHVVLEEDAPVFIGNRKLPCLELRDRISGGLLARYQRLMQLRHWVPCQQHLGDVPALTRTTWLDRMLVERLQGKAGYVAALLDKTDGDWDSALYRLLARSFGFHVNGPAFERLARTLPVKTIYQQGTNLLRIEALLYGAGGFLNRLFCDAYPVELYREFQHLARKYDVRPMDLHEWQWGRMRPANFPTIRIAQFAHLMSHGQQLLAMLCETDSIVAMRQLFAVRASAYWETHTDFDRPATRRVRKLGASARDGVLINTVVPFLFVFGKHTGREDLAERALDFMAHIRPEKNRITRRWESVGMPNTHAGQSQALIHLKRRYCDEQRCAQCGIGSYILLSNGIRIDGQ